MTISSSSSSKAHPNDSIKYHSGKLVGKMAKLKLPSKRCSPPRTTEIYPAEVQSYHSQELSKMATASSTSKIPEETDLSDDNHNAYFTEARSTPIIYSANSTHSSSSSSLDENDLQIRKMSRKRTDSLCSARSFSVAQQSTHSSTQNQTFYFGTPLSLQKHQPYQYHDRESSSYRCYGDESNTPPQKYVPTTPVNTPSSFLKRKKDIFLQSNSNRRVSISGASIRSAFSTGRQTIRSWRQKRINLMMKQQHLPEFETKAFCDDCEKYVQTRIRYKNGSMVWLVSFTL